MTTTGLCDNCAFADWNRTKSGALHPNKGGRCTRLDKHPLDLRLPGAFYWWRDEPPKPAHGYIERGTSPVRGCAFKHGRT